MIVPKHKRQCKNCGKEFIAKHRDTNFCSVRCKNKAWTKEHPNSWKKWSEKHPEYERNYRKRFPEKYRAQNHAYRNLPIEATCEKCGSTENLERHHPDYSKPNLVETVCCLCHKGIHRELLRK